MSDPVEVGDGHVAMFATSPGAVTDILAEPLQPASGGSTRLVSGTSQK